MTLTPDQIGAAIIANLPAKTGRTIDEWITIARNDEVDAELIGRL